MKLPLLVFALFAALVSGRAAMSQGVCWATVVNASAQYCAVTSSPKIFSSVGSGSYCRMGMRVSRGLSAQIVYNAIDACGNVGPWATIGCCQNLSVDSSDMFCILKSDGNYIPAPTPYLYQATLVPPRPLNPNDSDE